MPNDPTDEIERDYSPEELMEDERPEPYFPEPYPSEWSGNSY